MTAIPARQLRILIGENNADLAMTMSMLLETEPDITIVATVGSSREVRRVVAEQRPNAFILDLSLDDGSSMPLITSLRAQLPQAAIVVFTGHSNDMISEHCLRAGANAVVIKNSPIEELVAALRRAADTAAHPDGPLISAS